MRSSSSLPASFDWAPFFTGAGLNMTQWTPVAPKWNPDYYADSQFAWEGTFPTDPGTPLRIEASAYGGRPIQFELIGPWTQPSRVPPVVLDTGLPVLNRGVLAAMILTFLVALFFARRNLRLGRGDRKSANAIVLVLVVIAAITWVLKEHHVDTSWEMALLLMVASVNLLVAACLWIFYIALEPAVRRRWPGLMVASTRLLGGSWRDPLVGREVLIGSAASACRVVIERVGIALPAWLGRADELPNERTVGYTFADGFLPTGLLEPVGWAIFDVLAMLFFYLLIRTLLRRDWLAAVVVTLLLAMPTFLSAENPAIRGTAAVLGIGLLVGVMTRVGVIAGIAFFCVDNIFLMYPMTFDFSAWYSKVGLIALAWATAIALFGFFVSIRGQKLLDMEDEKAA
jgi:serine/threonine-protein kinase